MCAVFSLGEMVFSPLGYAFVAKYAHPKLLAVMMSVWSLATYFAGEFYVWIYEYMLRFKSSSAYFTMAIIVIITGVLLWCIDKFLISLVIQSNEGVSD